MHQDKLRGGLGLDTFQNLGKHDPIPGVVEAAPAGDTMKVTVGTDLGKAAKLIPGKPQRFFHRAPYTEIPSRRIEFRNLAIMKHRPLQGEGLAGRKSSRFFHLTLALLAFIEYH